MKTNNEFSFIKAIKNNIKTSSYISLGDDCSGQLINESLILLTTTDMLVENIHFKLDLITPFDLAKKSIEVNLSDIAAMGGKPKNIHISLAIPQKLNENFINQFYQGIFASLKKHNIELLGGDTTGSKNDFIINVTVQGEVEKNKVKTRNKAQKGDLICLTSAIGDSSLGLNLLLNNLPCSNYLLQSHNSPRAFIAEGLFLSNYKSVSSLIDLSDGLAKDLKHILEASGKGASVQLEKLPLSGDYILNYKRISDDKFKLAITGGEDYSLLFTVNPDSFQDLQKKYFKNFKQNITPIGVITDGNELQFYLNDKEVKLTETGFDHFLEQQ